MRLNCNITQAMATAIQFHSKTHVFDGVAVVTCREYSNDPGHNGWFEDIFLYSVVICVPAEFLLEKKLEILKCF